MGYPIRASPDQHSLTATRSLSQLATPFIATWHQGIHRTPFLNLTAKPLILVFLSDWVLTDQVKKEIRIPDRSYSLFKVLLKIFIFKILPYNWWR